MTGQKQKQIIEALHAKDAIDPAEEVRFRVNFLKEYALNAGMNGFVLGISGGQDSSLAGRLCQIAVEELRQQTGKEYQFIALRLPYGAQKDEEDAQRALQFIRPDRSYIINVQPAVDGAVAAFEQGTGLKMTDYNKGNQKAQERMTVQYRIAHQFNVLVVGTDHAAEAVVGFFTKYGDGGVDLTPLTGLNKQQGRLLLQHLGAPEQIYTKLPTADLLDQNPGRLDEDELGTSYEMIDAYLSGKEVPSEVAQNIEHRYQRTEHKRHEPVTPFDTWWKE
ncbi:ammonia-dependent NAD(+) synthetase [Ktedonosporobacter rubrisoli]|uniref:NH(3)-dependent NAD(+) synthetase n=1 Tax=Ktedonosporobacter rubrisoli TaxID=2509675 RepID=A0A4P6JNP9_KTERU|nr:ammonia-dependent NAD(+) synthetase [Ktedonosporobacter rubrisoli]QBD76947.1 ammonia-dependent NAD(+) synthetase [Ktedonosporobacter rubrisoli]